MIEIGARARTQPPPPWVVFEALTHPDRGAQRPWLVLLDDEQAPRVLEAIAHSRVVWSSLWQKRPDAVIRFDLSATGNGTNLKWSVLVAEPVPDDAAVGHMRKRMNELINANLRYTFGQ